MKLRKLLVFLMIFSLIAAPLYAKPNKGKGASASSKKASAGERIGNEFADSVADVLTGEDSKSTAKSKSKKVPPGLAKKGKTPPGWDKGKKTGWDKEEKEKKDSPIKSFVKGLFGQTD